MERSLIDLEDDFGYNTSQDGQMTDSEISIHVGEFRRRLLEYSAGRGPDPRKNLHLDFVEADMDRHLGQPRLVRANVTADGTPRDCDSVLEVAGFDGPDVPAGLSKATSSTGPVRSIKPADTTSGYGTYPLVAYSWYIY